MVVGGWCRHSCWSSIWRLYFFQPLTNTLAVIVVTTKMNVFPLSQNLKKGMNVVINRFLIDIKKKQEKRNGRKIQAFVFGLLDQYFKSFFSYIIEGTQSPSATFSPFKVKVTISVGNWPRKMGIKSFVLHCVTVVCLRPSKSQRGQKRKNLFSLWQKIQHAAAPYANRWWLYKSKW